MKVTLLPGPAAGRVTAIPSKSHLHRLFIYAALADKKTLLCCEHTQAEDIQATVACLSAIGAEIQPVEEGYLVRPLNRRRLPAGAVLPCGESGSTLRFMLPLVCALGISGTFTMSGRLPERPLAPLDEELSRHGIRLWRPDSGTLCCEGKLAAGNYTLPGNVSSQFISALLLALPLLEGDSSLKVEGPLESADYITMTLHAGEAFGFRPSSINNSYNIRGGAEFFSPEKTSVEGDWSNAAFWLCAGAMPGGDMEIAGLDRQSVQGDRGICNILEKMGANLGWAGNALRVFEGERRAVEIYAAAIPDIVPPLCAVAALGSGQTIIKNAGRLRLKESDRLHAIAQTLNAMGAEAAEEPDGLRIQGTESLSGGTVDAWGDHRIAMMAAVASLGCSGPLTITGAGAVRKSYPAFWEKFRAMGKEVVMDE